MKKRDLLYEAYYGKLSEKEAEELIFQYLRSDIKKPISDYLNINLKSEWPAIFLGKLKIKRVAKWRYEGFPTICLICNKTLDVNKDIWRAKKSLVIGGKKKRNVIVHQNCFSLINDTVKKRDLLQEVYQGKVSEKEAQKIIYQYRDTYKAENIEVPITEYLNIEFDNEWTAIKFWDMKIKTVATWRYEGWPDICAACNKPIDVNKDLWKAAKSIMIKGKRKKNVVVHQAEVNCNK